MQALTAILAIIGGAVVILALTAFTAELVDEIRRTRRVRKWGR